MLKLFHKFYLSLKSFDNYIVAVYAMWNCVFIGLAYIFRLLLQSGWPVILIQKGKLRISIKPDKSDTVKPAYNGIPRDLFFRYKQVTLNTGYALPASEFRTIRKAQMVVSWRVSMLSRGTKVVEHHTAFRGAGFLIMCIKLAISYWLHIDKQFSHLLWNLKIYHIWIKPCCAIMFLDIWIQSTLSYTVKDSF